MTTAPPDLSLRPALEALAARDADFARAYASCGLPPVRRQVPGFAGLLKIITAQQVSAASARAIIGRLDQAVRRLTPRSFLKLSDDDLRAIGFSRAKMRYGRALAEAVLKKEIDFAEVERLDDEDAIAHLTGAVGVGRWSAEVYLLFALQRPDIWPVGDLAVRVAAQRLKALPAQPSPGEMLDLGEPWRPYRSAAARFLWHFYRHPGVPLGDN
ncbi:MAG: DNA-3-methyladenine glycosylase family protein [Kiloniellales bacterium]